MVFIQLQFFVFYDEIAMNFIKFHIFPIGSGMGMIWDSSIPILAVDSLVTRGFLCIPEVPHISHCIYLGNGMGLSHSVPIPNGC